MTSLSRQTPPKLALRFFRWYCHPKLRDHIEGDLIEEYNQRIGSSGRRKADRKFLVDVLLLCRPGIIRPIRRYKNKNPLSMYRSYFIVAMRNMLRQKAHNILNVLGLSVGIASGLIIALHIRGELSYETSFSGYEHIYRVHREGWAASSPVLASEFRDFFPEVEVIGRFAPYGTKVVNTKNKNPGEATAYYADSSVLKVFGFELLDGDPHPLTALNTAVITQAMATRYFGTESPVGKILSVENGAEITITAVMEDLPANTHLKFDYLVSMPTLYHDAGHDIDLRRGWMTMYCYARVQPGSFANIASRMPDFIRKYYAGDPRVAQEVASRGWRLMALKDIHLHSSLEKEMHPNSNMVYVFVLMAVELLILIVASVNFMSLFMTQALKRVREVGMRKILGAKPGHLTAQFFTEVSLLIAISTLLGMVLYQVALPFYNDLTGKSQRPLEIFQLENLGTIGVTLLTVVLVSGLYPALFVAGLKPGSFLRENGLPNSIPNLIRSGLLIFQFMVSASLIGAGIIVRQQMDLMKNKDLGFDKEQVIRVKLYGDLRNNAIADSHGFKTEFLRSPDIVSVGRTDRMFGERISVEPVVPKDRDPEHNERLDVRVLRVDEGYLDVMKIPLTDGRNFSSAVASDATAFIINESAAKALGLANPVNQILENQGNSRTGKIVGVVKDYHFATLHSEIEPLVIEFKPHWTDQLVFRIRAGKTTDALEHIRETVDRLAPNSLFIYTFLDDRIDALYKSEDTMGRVFQFFSLLAIIIACMGLFGLSSYTIERRAKEIGIRKVLGATIPGVVSLVSSPFFKLIVAALCIAVPITWYAMEQWLDKFAYKIEIEWWVFVVTGLIVMVIAAFATGYHTMRATSRNPVDVLRSE